MRPCLPAGDGTSCLMGLLLDRPRQGTGEIECAGCGCPAAPIMPDEQLPRLPREETAQAGRWCCRICGGPLRKGKRTYCGAKCEKLRTHRRASHESPAVGV